MRADVSCPRPSLGRATRLSWHSILTGFCMLQWLNKVLLEMWPFYDYAVCEMIKVSPFFQ
jgi:hypothetical protein